MCGDVCVSRCMRVRTVCEGVCMDVHGVQLYMTTCLCMLSTHVQWSVSRLAQHIATVQCEGPSTGASTCVHSWVCVRAQGKLCGMCLCVTV